MATDSSHRAVMGKPVCHFFFAVFDRIPIYSLAGNDDIHKSLDEFKIQIYLTTDYRVSCPCSSEKFP